MLLSPKDGETIGIYLAVSEVAVSSVLFRDTTEQPIYFLSKKLVGAELTSYTKIELLGLSLMHCARRLKPYFQGRTIRVYTKEHLHKSLQIAPENSRLAEWYTYLSAYDIIYERRKAEKGQVLASLLADFPVEDALPDAPPSEATITDDLILSSHVNFASDIIQVAEVAEVADREQGGPSVQRWTAFSDGSANQLGSGLGCLIISPDDHKTERSVKLEFRASNNEAEYEAAIYTLWLLLTLGSTNADLYTDSKLLAN